MAVTDRRLPNGRRTEASFFRQSKPGRPAKQPDLPLPTFWFSVWKHQHSERESKAQIRHFLRQSERERETRRRCDRRPPAAAWKGTETSVSIGTSGSTRRQPDPLLFPHAMTEIYSLKTSSPPQNIYICTHTQIETDRQTQIFVLLVCLFVFFFNLIFWDSFILLYSTYIVSIRNFWSL